MVKMHFIRTVDGFQSQMTKIRGYSTPMMTNLTSFGDCQHGVLVLVTKLACGWQNIGSNFNRNMTKIDGIHTKKENQMTFITFLEILIRFRKNTITWKILLRSMFWESGQNTGIHLTEMMLVRLVWELNFMDALLMISWGTVQEFYSLIHGTCDPLELF